MCYRRQSQDTDGPVRQTASHGCLRMAMKNKGGKVSGCPVSETQELWQVRGENRKGDKPAETIHCERGVERNQEEKERDH